MEVKGRIEMGRAGCERGEVRRVGYTRKDGTKVRSTCVPDKGARGKTPAAKRWFPRNGKPLGWRKDMSVSERHAVLRKRTEQRGCLDVDLSLRSKANVTTDRETQRKMRADSEWLKKQGFCKLKGKKK